GGQRVGRAAAVSRRGIDRGAGHGSSYGDQSDLPEHVGVSGAGGFQRPDPRLRGGGRNLAGAAGQDRYLGEGHRADGFGTGRLALRHRAVRAQQRRGLRQPPVEPAASGGGRSAGGYLAIADARPTAAGGHGRAPGGAAPGLPRGGDGAVAVRGQGAAASATERVDARR